MALNVKRPLSLPLSWSLLGEILNLAGGVAVFVVAAIVLPLSSLGQYAGLVGLAAIATPLALMGRPQLLQIDFAAGEPASTSWRASIAVVSVACTGVSAVAAGIGSFLVEESGILVAALVVGSSIWGQAISEIVVTYYQAEQRMPQIAATRSVIVVARLAGALTVWLGPWDGLGAFAVGTALGWLAGAFFAVVGVEARLPRERALPASRKPWHVERGWKFVPSAASFALLDAVDRPLLVAFGFDADAGAYAAAFRFVGLTGLPLMALIRYTDADFYRLGKQDVREAVELADSLTKKVTLLHIFVGLGLLVGAPVLPLVLGSDFEGSVAIVRTLAVLPMLRGAQIFYSNALTGSGHQHDRNVALLVAMVLNLVLNLCLIPFYSWRGAVAATLFAEIVRTVLVRQRCRIHAGMAR